MAELKINPSLFDKLTLNDRVTEIIEEGASTQIEETGTTQLVLRSPNLIHRYNEGAMRRSVRRELNWLLNTVNLGALQDLSRYPQVRTSVLNYGLPDLTGRISTNKAIKGRAADIAEAIRVFEPRLDSDKLEVDSKPGVDLENSVSFVIRGDIVSAVRAMPVQFLANVEVETGQAVVRE